MDQRIINTREEIMEKVFFTPGDVVTLKQDIPNKPTMIVKSVDKVTIRGRGGSGEAKPTLFGITCIWFTDQMDIQEYRFNTKDLIHITTDD